MKIQGQRIYLQEISKKDITSNVMEWFKDDDLMRYYTSSKNVITKETLLSSIAEGKVKGNVFTFGVFDNDNDKLIGTIKLGPISDVHKTSDLVVLLGDANYRGKGLAVDAISLGNKLAFEKFNLRKLFGGMYLSNMSSIKAYTRAGWLIEGRLKGFYLNGDENEDRLLVGCYNPKYFSNEEINIIKSNEKRYLNVDWR